MSLILEYSAINRSLNDKTPPMMTGIQLRTLRRLYGLTQEQLSEKMNLAQQRIAAIEKIDKELSPVIVTNALTALQLSKELAIQVLTDLPPSAGGGVSRTS